jgi:hypothetical protein
MEIIAEDFDFADSKKDTEEVQERTTEHINLDDSDVLPF